MNKIKLFSSVVLSLALAGVSKAQFDLLNPSDLDAYHGRTLIVIVEKANDKVTEKLNKKHHSDKVDAYSKAIDTFNKNFADAVTQYWKVTEGDVQYKTIDDVNDIPDKKNYALLFCRSASQANLGTAYSANNGIWWWPDYKEVTHDKDFSEKITVMCLCLLEKFNKEPFYQFPMPDVYPTRGDLLYAVNAITKYADYRINHRKDSQKKMDIDMIQENQGTLRDKTLLLRRDWLDKKLTKTELDKDYPFPYMVAGADTVERLIDSADTKYAVAIVAPYDLEAAPSGGTQYVQYAFNIEDGAICGASGVPDIPSDPKAATSTTSASKPLITKKTLLDFSMYIRDADDSGDKGKKKGGKR